MSFREIHSHLIETIGHIFAENYFVLNNNYTELYVEHAKYVL